MFSGGGFCPYSLLDKEDDVILPEDCFCLNFYLQRLISRHLLVFRRMPQSPSA